MVDHSLPQPRLRPAREREPIPEPAMGRAGVQITFCASVELSNQLMAEVRRRNDTRALSRDWTIERLIEATLREKFP